MILDKNVQLCICKSGHMSIREKGGIDSKFPSALPFHSVDTLAEAEQIRLRYCKRQLDGTYVLSAFYPWKGDVEDVFTLAETLGLS